jgi:hypothetical protein
LVSRGLQAAWSEISQLTTIPPATLAKIQSDIQLVENDANLIATKEATAATPWIKELGPLVVDAANLALPFIPGGSPLQAILQAAISVLPAMFAAVGLSGAPGRATYSPVRRGRGRHDERCPHYLGCSDPRRRVRGGWWPRPALSQLALWWMGP